GGKDENVIARGKAGDPVFPGASDHRKRHAYCTLSATNRNSPSALETSSRTDFLPSFFSWSSRFLTSAALATDSCATSTMTSPAPSRLSAASEPASTLVTTT